MEFSLPTITASITALGAFIAALVLAYRGLSGDRFARKVSESAALLSGYTEMVKNLRLEIIEMRTDHDNEILRNRKQCQEDVERFARLHKFELDSIIAIYSEEHKHWDMERVRQSEQNSDLNERVDELQTQVYFLNNRPPETFNREGDLNA